MQVKDRPIACDVAVAIAVNHRLRRDELAGLCLEHTVKLPSTKHSPQPLVTVAVEKGDVVVERCGKAMRNVDRRKRSLLAEIETILSATRIDRAREELVSRVVYRLAKGVRSGHGEAI